MLKVIAYNINNNNLLIIDSNGLPNMFNSNKYNIVAMLKDIKIGETIEPNNYKIQGMFSRLCSNISDVFTFLKTDKKYDEVVEIFENTELDNIHLLNKYLMHAYETGRLDSLLNFVRNVNKTTLTIDQKKDLINFISKNNLPITINGNLLGYKRLVKKADGLYYDFYSESIAQSSYNLLKISDVDANDSIECSHGLHIASAAYLNTLSNVNSTFLVYFEVKNIIAVPKNDTSKIRVKEYLLLEELSDKSFEELLDNKIGLSNEIDNENIIRNMQENFNLPSNITVLNINAFTNSYTLSSIASVFSSNNNNNLQINPIIQDIIKDEDLFNSLLQEYNTYMANNNIVINFKTLDSINTFEYFLYNNLNKFNGNVKLSVIKYLSKLTNIFTKEELDKMEDLLPKKPSSYKERVDVALENFNEASTYEERVVYAKQIKAILRKSKQGYKYFNLENYKERIEKYLKG